MISVKGTGGGSGSVEVTNGTLEQLKAATSDIPAYTFVSKSNFFDSVGSSISSGAEHKASTRFAKLNDTHFAFYSPNYFTNLPCLQIGKIVSGQVSYFNNITYSDSSSSNMEYQSVFMLDSTHLVWAVRYTLKVIYKVYTLDDTSATGLTAYADISVPYASTPQSIGACMVDATHILRVDNVGGAMKATVDTIDLTAKTATPGTSLTLKETDIYILDVILLSGTYHCIYRTSNNSIYMLPLTVSGTAVTEGTPSSVISAYSSSEVYNSFAIPNSSVVICCGSNGTFGVAYDSGTYSVQSFASKANLHLLNFTADFSIQYTLDKTMTTFAIASTTGGGEPTSYTFVQGKNTYPLLIELFGDTIVVPSIHTSRTSPATIYPAITVLSTGGVLTASATNIAGITTSKCTPTVAGNVYTV